MILTPSAKLHDEGRGFKAILRLDQQEYFLPGVHETAGAAMQQAQALEFKARSHLKNFLTKEAHGFRRKIKKARGS